VPPMVHVPAAPGGALNRFNTMDTISASIFLTPGNTSGCIGFATVNLPYASVCSFSRSSSPWYTAPLTYPSSQRVWSMFASVSSSVRTASADQPSFGRVR
jgi:hypothetical protein